MGYKGKREEAPPATVFGTYSLGLATGRDAWVYSFSIDRLRTNVELTVAAYNAVVGRLEERRSERPETELDEVLEPDPRQFSWNRNARYDAARGRRYVLRDSPFVVGTYRPFVRQHLCFEPQLNAMVYQLPKLFPSPKHTNVGFYLNGINAASVPAVLMTDAIPCLDLYGKAGQFFPRWRYEPVDSGATSAPPADLFGSPDTASQGADELVVDGYRRIDNVTDAILADYRATFDPSVTKERIFFYVYGVLHSSQYREAFAADLKKMLPRIPKASSLADFEAFATAGHRLSVLHVGYESVTGFALEERLTGDPPADDFELYRVEKMRFAEKGKRDTIVYNRHLTLAGIPDEAYRYMLGSRSAIEWLIDRYRVTTHKDSGIVNDPNDWCREHANPRYIVDLIKSIVTVSLETMKIVDALPELPLGGA